MSGIENLLVDTISFRATGPVLESKGSGPGKYIARGEFARADRATENKRLYNHQLWERELGRLGKQLAEMKVYGELDHPMDGRTQLKRASHIITDLRLEGDVVVGSAHILDTDHGRNLKAILDAGGAVGVSSRGFGTTKPNMKGESVVQEDYRLMTFDFVAEPAQQSAYPVVSVEDVERSSATSSYVEDAKMDKNMTFEQLKESNPEMAASWMHDAEREYEKKAAEIWAKKIMGAKQEASSDLRGEFAEKLEAALADAKIEMEKSITDRLLNDPAVAGARKALGEMKDLLRPFIIPEDVESVVSEKEGAISLLESSISEKDLKIANLQAENDKLASIAREAGYRFHLEQRLNGVTNSNLVRELIGDVTHYAKIEEIDERIESIVEEIEKQVTEESVRDERTDRLERQLAEQKVITEKALEASKHLAAQVYLEQRLTNHPSADYARSLVEAHQPETKEEVDRLLSATPTVPRPSLTEDVDTARARVRGILNSGTREYLQEDQHVSSDSSGNNGAALDYNGLGANLSEIRTLSGLSDDGSSRN
jgi:hypothetical protein